MPSVCLSCRLPLGTSETHSLLWPCKHPIHEICAKTLANCTICHTPVQGLGVVKIKKIPNPRSSFEENPLGNSSALPGESPLQKTSDKTHSFLSTIFDLVRQLVEEPGPQDEVKLTVEGVVNAVTSFVQIAKNQGLSHIQVRFNGYLEAELLNQIQSTFANIGLEVTRSKETEFKIGQELLTDGEFQIGVRKYTKTEAEHPVFLISFENCQVTLVFSNIQYNP